MNARVLISSCVSALLSALAPPAAGAPGDVDPAFQVVYETRPVYFAVPRADGKIMKGGGNLTTGSVIMRRLQATGAADVPGLSVVPNNTVWGLNCLTDGKYLIHGLYTKIGSNSRFYFNKINESGGDEAQFSGSVGEQPLCVTLQPDGKILVGGNFTGTRNGLARFTAAGGLDAYNPNITSGAVSGIAVQADGKVVIVGSFGRVGGVVRARMARLLTDGTLDTTFNPAPAFDIYGGVLIQPDGKIIIARGYSGAGMARINPNGTVDATFTPAWAGGEINSMALQTDGKIIVGHEMSQTSTLRRLQVNGTADAGFTASVAFNIINSVFLLADGKVLAGGDFRSPGGNLDGAARRFLNDPATQSLEVPFAGNRIVWMRGGSSPEATHVSFEFSPAGGGAPVWTVLGQGTRIAGGWELSGLTLPATGQIRARAFTKGGYHCGSGSWVESILPYENYSPQQAWRLANFGTPDNTGPAADLADPDKDGLVNAVEYAFALLPNTPDAASLPQWQRDDDTFLLTFAVPPGVAGITYVAEYSTSLQSGAWTAADDAGTNANPVFFVTAAGHPRLYLRLRVTVP